MSLQQIQSEFDSEEQCREQLFQRSFLWPLRMHMTLVTGFSSAAIEQWARTHLATDSTVISDGLRGFRAIAAVCPHQVPLTAGGPTSVEIPEFNWVNTTLGNVKSALQGTYHAVRSRHLGRKRQKKVRR